jgi:hypothetical protein
LVVAAVLTVVALPFLWSSKQNTSGPESVAAIGAGETAAAVSGGTSESVSLDLGSSAFLSAPPADPDASVVPAVVTIDVAPPSPQNASTGPASYRQFDNDLMGADRPCATDQVPFGARVVVTNTDNGFRVACTNVLTKPLTRGEVVVLDTDTFLELADLGDSPIPVQISW